VTEFTLEKLERKLKGEVPAAPALFSKL